MSELKKMSIKDFRSIGYLQEVNRRILHPLGLALMVSVDDEGNEKFSGIWDCRDDPEGVRYDFSNPEWASDQERLEARAKKEQINAEARARMDTRIAAVGYWVEPVCNAAGEPEKDEGEECQNVNCTT